MHLYGAIFQTLNKDSSHITGKFCGESLPSSIPIGSSSIRLRFISDATDYATGFNLTYKALKPNYLPGKNHLLPLLTSRPFAEVLASEELDEGQGAPPPTKVCWLHNRESTLAS